MKLLKNSLARISTLALATGFTLGWYIFWRGRVSGCLSYTVKFLSPDFLMSLTGFLSHVQNPWKAAGSQGLDSYFFLLYPKPHPAIGTLKKISPAGLIHLSSICKEDTDVVSRALATAYAPRSWVTAPSCGAIPTKGTWTVSVVQKGFLGSCLFHCLYPDRWGVTLRPLSLWNRAGVCNSRTWLISPL